MPTNIEWTQETWNFIAGCTKKSEGCRNCYALRDSWRISHNPKAPARYRSVCEKVEGQLRWTGRINLDRDALQKPLQWREPRMIFVCSMSDLFHEDVPFEFIDRVFAIMARCPSHTFQVLTKRPDRAFEYLTSNPDEWTARQGAIQHRMDVDLALYKKVIEEWPLPNVWIGASVEDQRAAERRIHYLLQLPAAVRFISAEPLLGGLDLTEVEAAGTGGRWRINALTGDESYLSGVWHRRRGIYPALDLVIAGGESGPGARPTHPDRFRSLRDQCVEAEVPLFFKQWGAWAPVEFARQSTGEQPVYCPADDEWTAIRGPRVKHYSDGTVMARVGKKAAGRLLDGREWNQMPEIVR